MGFFDAILEGIGNVVLLIIGIILLFFGIAMMGLGKSILASILGFVIFVIGLGCLIAKYRR